MNNRLILIVLFLVGVPAIVVLFLLDDGGRRDAQPGAQPGCVLRGTVHDEAGRPVPDTRASAFAVAPGTPPRLLVESRTNADGVYELTLPPIGGRYELRYLATELAESRVPFVVAGPAKDGSPIGVAANLDVTLKPGAQLVVDILRADGRPASGGRYELASTTSGGFLGGFGGQAIARDGDFTAGSFLVDSLSPTQVRLFVALSTGETIEAILQLAPGKNRHQVQL